MKLTGSGRRSSTAGTAGQRGLACARTPRPAAYAGSLGRSRPLSKPPQAIAVIRLALLLALLVCPAPAQSQEVPACSPPDTLAWHQWLKNQQASPQSESRTGVIANRDGLTPKQEATLVRRAAGAYAGNLLWSTPTAELGGWTPVYFTLHVPTRAEVARLQAALRFETTPALVGYLWGSKIFAKDTLYPQTPRTILGVVSSSGGIDFRVEGMPYCDDCGGFEITTFEGTELRGRWDRDGSVVPETFGWFCAGRVAD
jgi:hypothetical protein